MTSTSETLTHEHATIHTSPGEPNRPARIARTHFTRLGGLYAWILVTLAIFLLAAMLSGIQKGEASTVSGPSSVESVGTARFATG
jgi:hypothetical protein